MLFLASFLLLTQAAAALPQNVTPAKPVVQPAPQNVTPAKPGVQPLPLNATPPSPDPASTHFVGDVGIVLVAVKPLAAPDYEDAIRTLQEALSKTTDPTKAAAAKGWRVYKTSETDAKLNVLYVHVMLPAVAGFDYRPSLLLDELVKDLAPGMLSKYSDAFATPPTRLNLTEFANMSVAPLPLPPPTVPVKPKG